MSDIQQERELAVESNSLSIQEIISKFLPYWPLFLALIIAGGVIAFFKLRYATPIYEAHASILIKDDDRTGQAAILEQLNMTGNRKILQNEIELLRSRPMLTTVVKNLHLYASVTEEGNVRKLSAYTYSPVVFTFKNPDSLKPAAQVYFTYNTNGTVSFDNKTYPLNQYVTTPYGVMMIIKNKYYVARNEAHPIYFSLASAVAVAGGLQGGLSIVNENKESTVVNLTYTDESPERAKDILNELVKVYNDAAVGDKNKQAESTLRFVNERLKYVENDLDSVERKLEGYKSANRIVSIGAQGEEYLKNVSANDQRITELDMQLAALNEAQKYVQGKGGKGDAIVPSILGIADPVLNGLLENLQTAEAKRIQLSQTVGDNYPSAVALKDEIDRLRPKIMENMRTQRQGILASRSDLQSVNNRYNGMLSAIPSQERNLINISRQQSIKNTIYTFLLQKREETMLTFASQISDSRLVNDAQVLGIVSPVSRNIYLQWIISAVILGFLFVFVRENLNRNIISRPEIEKITSVPIIAEITYNKSAEPVVVEQGSRSLIAEQFRYMRTSLNYIGITNGKKKILFTSSISGEGKSFITTNLGATLAITGKKVVILEMDLRKPKLSEMLNLDKNNGLSDYFIGNKSVNEIVKPTQVPNMFLISSGAIPPNPAELLMNGRLPELLTDLEELYDYVLIDTAPVSPVTDAYLISPLCDATLYVVRQGRTPRVLIQKLNDLLRNKRLKNMSIVFNGVKQKRFGSYYGYGYTYGYGYLDEKTKKRTKQKKG